jgi:hypothetical protein
MDFLCGMFGGRRSSDALNIHTETVGTSYNRSRISVDTQRGSPSTIIGTNFHCWIAAIQLFNGDIAEFVGLDLRTDYATLKRRKNR